MFNDYLKYGGLPFTINLNNDNKLAYLRDVYNSILFNDINKRYNIRNIDMLERLILFLIGNIGKTFSSNSLSKYLKHEGRSLSVETIANYLNYITSSYLFQKAQREDLISKKVLTISEKYYLVDTGFYNAFIINNVSRSQLLENVVFNELTRRGYSVYIGKVNNLEVDFVCKKHNKKIYIQVSESILDENTREREFKPLLRIKDFYPKYILSLDDWDYSYEGIIHLNIVDFLKDESI